MLMHYVYLLQSISNNKIYIGYTKDLRKRFTAHQQGMNRATKSHRPWKLTYYEAYIYKEDAIKRENMLKTYPKTLGGLKRRLQKSLKHY